MKANKGQKNWDLAKSSTSTFLCRLLLHFKGSTNTVATFYVLTLEGRYKCFRLFTKHSGQSHRWSLIAIIHYSSKSICVLIAAEQHEWSLSVVCRPDCLRSNFVCIYSDLIPLWARTSQAAIENFSSHICTCIVIDSQLLCAKTRRRKKYLLAS